MEKTLKYVGISRFFSTRKQAADEPIYQYNIKGIGRL
jgi:hypothetical protein